MEKLVLLLFLNFCNDYEKDDRLDSDMCRFEIEICLDDLGYTVENFQFCKEDFLRFAGEE